MKPFRRPVLLAAGLLGLSGVILAALGSHAVPGLERFGQYRNWQSANLMHLVHAVAILALSFHVTRDDGGLPALAAALMTIGVILFSGTIYLSIGTALPSLTFLAPAGGLMLMAGWALILFHALRRPGP